ncbi:MAG: Mur ligase family protein [Bacteroidales bacterium]
MDPDHLEIYGDHKSMISAYNEFAGRVKRGGKLLVNSNIRHLVRDMEGIKIFTYGTDRSCDFYLSGSTTKDDITSFSVVTPSGEINDLSWNIPGTLNLVNAVAAISLATIAGVKPDEIRKSIMLFQGVARRFDIRYSDNHTIYI